ncbi:hypothetical protein EXN66_Car016052 [Channa argus]|uniref:Uncharacterized protein n=1 Tax=Channa argus TaxID=215402 RepID=A0A6G1QCU2_CHAAH|nr:hypothetical protein EXN66_Car016052 [Channa argus]
MCIPAHIVWPFCCKQREDISLDGICRGGLNCCHHTKTLKETQTGACYRCSPVKEIAGFNTVSKLTEILKVLNMHSNNLQKHKESLLIYGYIQGTHMPCKKRTNHQSETEMLPHDQSRYKLDST